MRIKRIIIVILCVLALLDFSVYSHSGRTDSSGGHWNLSTGEYHYHDGEYAGRESSEGLSWIIKFLIFGCIFLVIIGGLLFYWSIYPYFPKNLIFNFKNAIKDYENALSYYRSCENNLKAIKEKATPPEGYKIGYDGLPKEIDSVEWGESLTIFTKINGWKIHLKEYCDFPLIKHHAYHFYNKRYSVCQKCAENYEIPNMEWYIEYLKIAKFEKQYEYARKDCNNSLNKLHSSYNDCKTKRAKFFFAFTQKKKHKLNKLITQYQKTISNN